MVALSKKFGKIKAIIVIFVCVKAKFKVVYDSDIKPDCVTMTS